MIVQVMGINSEPVSIIFQKVWVFPCPQGTIMLATGSCGKSKEGEFTIHPREKCSKYYFKQTLPFIQRAPVYALGGEAGTLHFGDQIKPPFARLDFFCYVNQVGPYQAVHLFGPRVTTFHQPPLHIPTGQITILISAMVPLSIIGIRTDLSLKVILSTPLKSGGPSLIMNPNYREKTTTMFLRRLVLTCIS